MSAVIRIRDVRVGDAAELAQLVGELGYPTETPLMAARLSALLGREQRRIRVAERGGAVCGWVEAGLRLTLDTDERVEILALIVAEKVRQHGVGRLLVTDIEQWARALGMTSLVVRSNILRDASHPFYRQLGFEQRKTQHYYVKAL
ncbi:MAG TPA: GNAT family N-acetyltransferase [Rhodanobacteraceae bacterium]|nr:GNAT family N-acetyltransferase [Rhodanobacteraceae bacterium]